MSAKAYVLMEIAVGKNRDVVQALRQLKGVVSADSVTGGFDVIAIIEAESLNEVGDLITRKIHHIAGVSRTVTCLVI